MSVKASVRCALQRVTPDNLRSPRHTVSSAPGLCLGILGPSSAVRTHGTSALLGDAIAGANWYEPGRKAPDGSYALFRTGERHVELVADLCSSRTLWYLIDDEVFVASTSQRAIVAAVGGFSASRSALSWFLSTGTMGPRDGWDKRVRHLQPGERLLFDRATWKKRSTIETSRPTPLPADGSIREAAIAEALDRTFSGRDWSSPPWSLALSGGADSRAILLKLKDPSAMSCMTWGEEGGLERADSDGVVAALLTAAVGARHRLIEIDEATPLDTVLSRFVANAEARSDKPAGYLDGFSLWAEMATQGTQGVLRGDTVFIGWGHDDTQARIPRLAPLPSRDEWLRRPASRAFARGWQALTFADFDDQQLRDLAVEFPPQLWPESLLLQDGETGPDWRGRLYRQYQYQATFAPLNEAKAAYVEVANPLLSRDLIDCAAAMVDAPQASTKMPFVNVVRRLAPTVPFASRDSITDHEAWLRRGAVQSAVRETLIDADASALIPVTVRDLVLRRAVQTPRSARLKGTLKKTLRHAATPALQARVRRRQPALLSAESLGLRCLLACRMDALLRDDAAAGRRRSTGI